MDVNAIGLKDLSGFDASVQPITAVHVEYGASSELVANYKKQRLSEFGRAAYATHGHMAPHLLKEFLFFVWRHPIVHRRIDQAGRHYPKALVLPVKGNINDGAYRRT